jgi:hypothetical protein
MRLRLALSMIAILALLAPCALFAATPIPEVEPPLDGAGEEPELPPVKTVKLTARRDRLTLTDGKTVEGSIVAVGSQSVIIITAGGEKTIPRNKIENIERARVGAEMLERRTFETEVVDGHEHIVVPAGLDEEPDDGPPGIIPPAGARKTAGLLTYKLRKGDALAATFAIATTVTEDLPGKERARSTEMARMQITATAVRRAATGVWMTQAKFKLLSLMRGNADVTKLEAKRFDTANVLRSMSPLGRWQPGADNVSGVLRDDGRFVRWLGHLTVPLPAKPAKYGEAIPLNAVLPVGIAHLMLPPPEGVATEKWTVTGKYVVNGTGDVGGLNCAIIAIELKGVGAGTLAVDNRAHQVDVQATGRWHLDFAIAEGRPVRCAAESTSVLVGRDPKLALKRVTEIKAGTMVKFVAGRKPTVVKPQPAKPKPPATGRTLDDDLDDLLKKNPKLDFLK